MKIMNPIWNADFNSLITKDGTNTRIGAVSAFTSGANFASLANKAKSDCRVCFTMKLRIGASPLSSACSKLMVFLVKGKYASAYTLSKVGPITKNVKNRESPTIT